MLVANFNLSTNQLQVLLAFRKAKDTGKAMAEAFGREQEHGEGVRSGVETL